MISLAAVALAALSFFRNASDKRIDERIDLKLAADIAVIHQQLATIQASVTNSGERDAALVRGAVEATSDAIKSTAHALVTVASETRRTRDGEPRIGV